MKAGSLAAAASWLGAASGAGLPALSYFTTFAPPLFAGASLITGGLAAAILVIAAAWKTKDGAAVPGSVKTAVICLVAALASLIAYSLLLQFTTVVGPESDGARYQIGFGRAEFSLTDVAKGHLKHNPTLQPKQLMMYEAAFDQD